MTVAKKIAADAALHGILLDAIAYFGLAELYPQARRTINDIKTVYLEPETGIFKIILLICLQHKERGKMLVEFSPSLILI